MVYVGLEIVAPEVSTGCDSRIRRCIPHPCVCNLSSLYGKRAVFAADSFAQKAADYFSALRFHAPGLEPRLRPVRLALRDHAADQGERC